MARKSRYGTTSEETKIKAAPSITLAAAYTRISVDDGDSEIDESIINQQKIIQSFLQAHPDIRLVETYADNGYSGMNFNRPGFQKMLQDLNEGKFSCIIVKDISRFGRNFIITSEFLEKILPEMGIRLISINDDFDSLDSSANVNELIMPLKMIMNDEYVRDISKKIRSSITAKMENGEFLPAGGSIPYGYLRNPEKCTYDIDKEAAQIVVRIFEERGRGVSHNEIAKRLNLDGVPSPGRLRYMRGQTKRAKYQDAIWTCKTIRSILSDRTYLGERIHGKMKRKNIGEKKEKQPKENWTTVKNAHEPIIHKELFEKVQKEGERIRDYRSLFKDRKAEMEDVCHEWLFKKIYCADCGSPMRVQRQKKSKEGAKTSIAYECSKYVESQHLKCGSHRIQQGKVIRAVENAIMAQIRLSVDLQKLIDDISRNPDIERYQKELLRKLSSIRIKKNNLIAKKEKLLIDLVNGLISRAEYEYMKEQYQEQIEKISREEEILQDKSQQWKGIEADALKWISQVQTFSEKQSISREIMDFLIDRIYVAKDQSIEINFAFADPFAPMLDFLKNTAEDREELQYV